MSKKVLWAAVAVLVMAAIVPGLNAQPTSILTENFEGSFPPSGWQTTVGGECSNQWFRNDYTSEANHTGGSGYCACNDDDYWGYVYISQNSLESSEFDCTGYDEVWLAYNVCWEDYEGTEHAYVDLYYEGANYAHMWMQIWEVENTGYDQNRRDSIDITPYVRYSPEGIKIRFRYNEDEPESGWAYWYQVDNVRVWGSTEGGEPGEDSLDLAMAQIIRPKDVEPAGEAFNPSCKVYNNVDDTVLGDVRSRITELSGLTVVYDKVLTNVPLVPGYTVVEEFPAFTPEGGKKYKVDFIVINEDDVNETNNNLTKNWESGIGEEVTAVAMVKPDENQLNSFKPLANFVEMTGDSITASLICQIADASYSALIYADTIADHSFTGSDTFPAEFKEVTGLTDGSSYTISFWAINMKDVNISDPVLVKDFVYTGVAEKPEKMEFGLSVSGQNVVFSLAKSTRVSLKVYDAAGNLVATLANGTLSAGSHHVTLSTVPGVYFVKLVTPEYSAVRKALIIK